MTHNNRPFLREPWWVKIDRYNQMCTGVDGDPGVYEVMSITVLQREVTCSLQASFILRKQRAIWGFRAPGSVVQISGGHLWRTAVLCIVQETRKRLMSHSAFKPHAEGIPRHSQRKPPGRGGVREEGGGGITEEPLVPDQAYLWWLRLQHRLAGCGESSGSSRSPVPHR